MVDDSYLGTSDEVRSRLFVISHIFFRSRDKPEICLNHVDKQIDGKGRSNNCQTFHQLKSQKSNEILKANEEKRKAQNHILYRQDSLFPWDYF